MPTNYQGSQKTCISCHQGKRKCDGRLCSYCRQNKHECEYGPVHRKKQTRNHQTMRSPHSADSAGTTVDAKRTGASQLRLLEANSASVFVRQLGLKINPASALPLRCYAWNLGLENESVSFPQVAGSVI
ncbi:hypothetical protein BDV06DRAFT_223717 [Aspergillus oleicola]